MDSTDRESGAAAIVSKAALMQQFVDHGWTAAIGLEFETATVEQVVAVMRVTPRHLQPLGLVHGGVFASIVETCCSVGAALSAPNGKHVVGMENHTSFLRPVRSGELRARAWPLQAGRRAQLWQCDVCDEARRLVATGQLRLMCVEPVEESVGGDG